MHECHIVEKVVKEAAEQARNSGVAAIGEVYLSLDASSGFDETSVRLYFGELSRGTVVENARLHIKILPEKIFCPSCKAESERAKGQLTCRVCNSNVMPVKGRSGLLLEKIVPKPPVKQ